MGASRLFIGGVSADLEQGILEKKLSKYGTVVNIEIKEKKDVISGEVVKRFAFATLDGAHSDIEKCIYSLNGSTLNGATLSVERAQESFIERIKREREERVAGKPSSATSKNEIQYRAGVHNLHERKEKFSLNNFSADDSFNNYSNDFNYKAQTDSWKKSGPYLEKKTYDVYSQIKNDPDQQATVKDELLPSLASYSSAWRDDDESIETSFHEGDGTHENLHAESPHTKRKVPVMRRYDPTKPAPQADNEQPSAASTCDTVKVTAAAHISKDLVFSGASGTFSLLDLLDGKLDSSKAIEGDQSLPATDRIIGQENTKSDEDLGQNDQQNELERHRSKNRKKSRKSDVEAPAKAAALPPYVKKEKFFIDSEDSCIGESVAWLYEVISDQKREEFREVRREIASHCTYRMRRARTDTDKVQSAVTSTQDWWGSSRYSDEAGSVEPATLVSEVVSGVASAVRTSYSDEKKVPLKVSDSNARNVTASRQFTQGRGLFQNRGRTLAWGGRGSFRGGSSRGLVRGGTNERG